MDAWHTHHAVMSPCKQRHLRTKKCFPICDLACYPVQFSCRCDFNTCKHMHASDHASHGMGTHRMQRMYHTPHLTQQWEFDSANSSSDRRSELEQLSNFPAGGGGKAYLKVACFCCRIWRLSCDRSRQLRGWPLAKHSCACLLSFHRSQLACQNKSKFGKLILM